MRGGPNIFIRTPELVSPRRNLEDPVISRERGAQDFREPELFVVTTRAPTNPTLHASYNALRSFYEDEAFDYKEGVDILLGSTSISRDNQAIDTFDKLVRGKHIVRLEEM